MIKCASQVVKIFHRGETVTVFIGTREDDGSSVWELEVYSGRHSMSERTCDIGVVKVTKREENQAIVLDVERKCRQLRVANSVEVLHSIRWVCQ